ncbi:signaling lymphocytic activation molecule-like [Rana temporaria]|uniref:signaling lymphocytic activation molecule-like n=1 Tax=Rana temporaria TaxID=8407 RepID=UPI001AAD8A9A|nr:signaling lymphocytic activation molecule-like [Rana temporaria]
MKGRTVDRVSSLKLHRKATQHTHTIMFYYCYIICFIACECFGLVSQCGDLVTELKGVLGQPFYFEKVALELKYDHLTLQQTIKNQRTNLLIYSHSTTTEERYRYNEGNSSFEILKLQREDQGTYEIKVTNGSTETFCKYDLKVYEMINNVTVNVTHSLQNDSCMVTMDCVPQTGDNITFGWIINQTDLHYKLLNSTVRLCVTKDNATSTYTCQAENPVSRVSRKVNLMEICGMRPAASVNNFDPKYLPIGLLAVIIIVIVGILIRKIINRKIGKLHIHPQSPLRMPPPSNPELEAVATEGLNTVYAAVQKKELSATSPNQVPSEPVKQVPITVYDNVKRKKSEDNYTTVYELAGPCTIDP